MHFDEIPPWRTLTWPQSPKDGLLHTGTTNRNAGEHPGAFYKVTVIYMSHLPTLSVLRSVGGRKTNANSDGWRRPGWLNGWGSVYIFQMWTKDNSCQKSWRKMRGGDQCAKSNNQTIWVVIIHIFWSDCACSQEKLCSGPKSWKSNTKDIGPRGPIWPRTAFSVNARRLSVSSCQHSVKSRFGLVSLQSGSGWYMTANSSGLS